MRNYFIDYDVVDYDTLLQLFYDNSTNEYNNYITNLTHNKYDDNTGNWTGNPSVIWIMSVTDGKYQIFNKEKIKNKHALEKLEDSRNNIPPEKELEKVYPDIKDSIIHLQNFFNKYDQILRNLTPKDKYEKVKRFYDKLILVKNELEEINCFHEPFFQDLYKYVFEKEEIKQVVNLEKLLENVKEKVRPFFKDVLFILCDE